MLISPALAAARYSAETAEAASREYRESEETGIFSGYSKEIAALSVSMILSYVGGCFSGSGEAMSA